MKCGKTDLCDIEEIKDSNGIDTMNAIKENMWRELQGLKPIQSWKCKLNFHKWTNYEVVDPRHDFGSRLYAVCHCADCGMPRIEEPFSKSNKKVK